MREARVPTACQSVAQAAAGRTIVEVEPTFGTDP
jgi:hypothetical protein